jgi:hypothetical protein
MNSTAAADPRSARWNRRSEHFQAGRVVRAAQVADTLPTRRHVRPGGVVETMVKLSHASAWWSGAR